VVAVGVAVCERNLVERALAEADAGAAAVAQAMVGVAGVVAVEVAAGRGPVVPLPVEVGLGLAVEDPSVPGTASEVVEAAARRRAAARLLWACARPVERADPVASQRTRACWRAWTSVGRSRRTVAVARHAIQPR
jgi:hypothetical protein